MTVEFSGPLFDGTAERLLARGADAAELEIGERVQEAVRGQIRAQARSRTGFYESRVLVDLARGDLSVSDRKVRYGGWLEGTWPRNKRTGFAGYRQWERALRQVEPQAVGLAEKTLDPFIDKMG